MPFHVSPQKSAHMTVPSQVRVKREMAMRLVGRPIVLIRSHTGRASGTQESSSAGLHHDGA